MSWLNKKITKNYYPGGFPDPNPYPDDLYVWHVVLMGIVALGFVAAAVVVWVV